MRFKKRTLNTTHFFLEVAIMHHFVDTVTQLTGKEDIYIFFAIDLVFQCEQGVPEPCFTCLRHFLLHIGVGMA